MQNLHLIMRNLPTRECRLVNTSFWDCAAPEMRYFKHSLRFQAGEPGKCPGMACESDGRDWPAATGEDPGMPCSRADFVNSAVVRMPSLRITFDLWKVTVLPEISRITAIVLMQRPSAASCTLVRRRPHQTQVCSPAIRPTCLS